MATTTEVLSHVRSSSTTSVAALMSPNTTVSSVGASTMGKRVHREVRFGAYVLGSTLGEGEFGKVKLGWRKDGKHPSQVAIKLIKRDSIMKDSESEVKIHREINSLRLLSHPNIVNLVEVLKSGKYIGIVLEYASGGELFDYILQHKYLKENVAKKLFAQLVSGVDYMHLKGLIHRDLKLENLLLDKHKNIVISDFGFVNSYNRDRNDLMKTSCGSPCYAAPELVLTQSPYSGRKVDIWSLGVILYAMLSGYLPFDDDAENEDSADIVRLYHYICNTPLTFPEYVSPLARDLLRKIIVSDPEKRICMDEIRNHPWLAPHANLLSIRQPEWDRIHSEDKERLRTAHLINPSKQKRFSMFNETTSSSTLMLSSTKNPHGRTYTSNSNIIYSNPTTSSSLANVVALTNSNEPNLATSASSVTNGSTSTLSSTVSNAESCSPSKSSQFVFQRGHSKSASMSGSYSSASHALKAVATEHDNQRKSLHESDVPTNIPNAHYGHLPNGGLPRSSTYTGTISTIVESPTNAEFDVSKQKEWLERNTHSPDLAKEARLPHSQNKPRPTSYHPGSMSSSLLTNNSATMLEYVKLSSPKNLATPQFLSGSPTKSTLSAELVDRGLLGSPIPQSSVPARRANSRRDSVVTAINVNGVLTSDLSSHENKRNSVLSYLEDKMDTLDLTELQSPTRPASESTAATLPPPALKLDTDLPPPKHVTPQINQLPTFAVPTESPKEREIVKESGVVKEREVSKEKETVKEKLLEDDKENIDKERMTRPTEVTSRERNKESKEIKEAKKRNRFSILSFYSNSNASSSLVDTNSVHSSGKKVLEPSNEANVSHSAAAKEQKRVGSSSSNKSAQNRKSIAAGSVNGTYVNGKEASAARKVMNFFKRRSIRIG